MNDVCIYFRRYHLNYLSTNIKKNVPRMYQSKAEKAFDIYSDYDLYTYSIFAKIYMYIKAVFKRYIGPDKEILFA